jgi:hypothetical protein
VKDGLRLKRNEAATALRASLLVEGGQIIRRLCESDRIASVQLGSDWRFPSKVNLPKDANSTP